jgi:hypothetical protein
MESNESKMYIVVKLENGTDRKIEIDEDGFLVNPDDRCKEFLQLDSG